METQSIPHVGGKSNDFNSDSSVLSFDQEDLESIEEETDTPVKKKLKRAMSTVSTFSSIGRKRSRTSVYETAANTTADGMASLGASIKDAQLLPQQTRFDQCIEVLNEMRAHDDISSGEYFSIVQVFMDNQQYSALFYGMTADLRMEWLVSEGLINGLN